MARPGFELRTAVAYTVLVLAWGLNYLFVRVGLSESPPLWLAFLRAFVGAVGVIIALAATSGFGTLRPEERRRAIAVGIPTFGMFFGLWFSAAIAILPGEAAVFVYTFPLWVSILSVPVLGQRIRAGHLAAVALGFTGVLLLAAPWNAGTGSLPLVPVLELLGGAVSWATGTVVAQRWFRPEQMMEANAYQLLGGSSVLLLASLLVEPTHLPHPSWTLAISVVWLGLVGTAIGYAIWFHLLSRYRASVLSAYVFLVPVVALVASVLILGERLGVDQVGGVALVLVGLLVLGRVVPGRLPTSSEPA